MGVHRTRKARDVRLGSNWLPPYERRIAPGVVVSYRTFSDHVDGQGRSYPRGTLCRALRAPSGELCLLFWKKGKIGEFVAVWLPEWTGLVGIEPSVCDPMKENMAFVTEVIAGVDARVARELREETEAERKKRSDQEDSTLSEILPGAFDRDELDGAVVEEDDGEA